MKQANKLWLTLLLTALLLLGTVATGFSAVAEGETSHIVAEGNCGEKEVPDGNGWAGDNLHWTLTSKGTLTVTGEGKMWEVFSFHPIWHECMDLETGEMPAPVRIIIIEPGATNISRYAFSCSTELKTLLIPDTVTVIDPTAFEYCGALKSVFYTGTPEQWQQIEGVDVFGEDVTVRCNITEWGFCGSTYVSSTDYSGDNSNLLWTQNADGQVVVSGAGEMATGGLNWSPIRPSRYITSAVVEADLEMLPYSALSGCSSMTNAVLTEGLKTIDGYAFEHCGNLTSVTIPASVTRIHSHGFFGCYQLSDVYYGGTREQWSQIDFGEPSTEERINYNESYLFNAHIHFLNEPDNITWSLEDGVLTISGTGAIWPTEEKVATSSESWNSETQTWQSGSGYYYKLHYPWEPDEAMVADLFGGIPIDIYGRVVKKIVVEEGITEIIGNAFQWFAPETVILPATLKRVAAHRTAGGRSAPFEPIYLKDLYIGNPDAVFYPDGKHFSGDGYYIELSGSAENLGFESYDEIRSTVKTFYDDYLPFALDPFAVIWGEGLFALQSIYEARHHAVISMSNRYYVNDDALDVFIAGCLRQYADSWEMAGIRYDTFAHFEADLIAKLNERFGSSFSSSEELFTLKPAETEGERPTAEYSEVLTATVQPLLEELKAFQESSESMDGSLESFALGGTPIAKINERWNQETQSTEYDDLPLTPYPWITIHGYPGSTAETAAATSGVKFAPFGTCGDNLVWTLSGSTLTISGEGAIPDYTDSEPAPWMGYFAAPGAKITVVLEEGVTRIGANAFPANAGLFELIVLNKQCDLSALVILEPAMLRGYIGSTAETYGNAHEDDGLFEPLCTVDYHHAVELIREEPSTCTVRGHEPGIYCVDCERVIYGNQTKPLADHTWTDWSEKDGVKTRTCTACGKIQKEGERDNFLVRAMTAIITWLKKLLRFFS